MVIRPILNPEPVEPPLAPGGYLRKRCFFTLCDYPHSWLNEDDGITYWCGSYA